MLHSLFSGAKAPFTYRDSAPPSFSGDKAPFTHRDSFPPRFLGRINRPLILKPYLSKESYEFGIRFPYDGLGIHPQGGRIDVTAVLPRMAELDGNVTKGVDEQGVEVNEIPYPTPNVNRKIVTFAYQKDPLFTIRYNHKQGFQN